MPNSLYVSVCIYSMYTFASPLFYIYINCVSREYLQSFSREKIICFNVGLNSMTHWSGERGQTESLDGYLFLNQTKKDASAVSSVDSGPGASCC